MNIKQRQEIKNLLNLIDYNMEDFAKSLPAAKELLDNLFQAYGERSTEGTTYEEISNIHKKLFKTATITKEVKFHNIHTMKDESGCEYATVLPKHIIKEHGHHSYDIAQFMKSQDCDYYLTEEEAEGKFFIHFTNKENVESILKSGIRQNTSEFLSFGTGIYFYELENNNFSYLSDDKNFCAVIFKLPKGYYKCVADLADGNHDGSMSFPPYYYYTQSNSAEYIVGPAYSKEEALNFLPSQVKTF